MSNFDQVKESVSLKEYAEAHLTHARGGLICPLCGSGTGQNKTPAFKIYEDTQKWWCFSCNAHGDIYDLAGIIGKTENKAEQLRIVAEFGGIDLGERDNKTAGESRITKRITTGDEAKTTSKVKDEYAEGRAKHRQYIADCARRLKEEPNETVNAYLEARGFTIDDAVRIGFGYDANPEHGWKDEAGNWHKSPRLVIPWEGNDYYHIDRAVDDRAHDLKYDKPKEIEVGAQPLYNPEAFEQDYVIAVEGVLDAIALQLCDFNAVALGGTATRNFVNEAAARNYRGVVIDMLDADGAMMEGGKWSKGRGAGAELVSLLADVGITTLSRMEYGVPENFKYGQAGVVSEGYKDAGEWFAADPRYLKDFMSYAVKMAHEKAQQARDNEYREALRSLKLEEAANIARDILACKNEEQPISTGFYSLDNAINGGLRSGLTVLGAVSSSGKTTLLSQIADFIAASGRPVLFVSIEQSGRELVSKSISRMMANRGYNGVTLYEMDAQKFRNLWSDDKAAAMADVVEEYADVIAPNLHIMAASEQPTIYDVKRAAHHIANERGVSPVIMLDYLQILKPMNERDTERQAVDFNISELRRLSGGNGLKTPVIAISSLNRGSYTGAIEMESFKESGGIEFGADLLLGLQPYNMEAAVNAETKKGTPPDASQMKFRAREIVKQYRKQGVKYSELVFMKNRNGALPERPLPFTFYGASSLFVEGVNHI